MVEQWPDINLAQGYIINGINGLNSKIRGFTLEVYLQGRQYRQVWLDV